MTSSSMKAKIIRVKMREGKSGYFFATSPELRGLLVTEPTIDELLRSIPTAIRDLYAACDLDVVVEMADERGDEYIPWIAFPAEVARKALGERTAQN